MRLGVTTLPPLPRDATDRNRTSPFAFTGNKFEFRAVGSSQSVATPNTYLNTAVADSLRQMADKIEAAARKGGIEAAVQQVVQATLKDHYRIVFNGNNYAKEWEIEAESRGLPNFRNTVDSLVHLASEKNVNLFERQKVFSRTEVLSRAKIAFENYEKAIAIEAQSMAGLATTSVLPAALQHQERTARSIAATRQSNGSIDLAPQEAALRSVSSRINELIQAIEQLQSVAEKAEEVTDSGHHEKAYWYRDKVRPAMERTRLACDALEVCVDDDLWPLPKYREMLFIH
jgi:glutamine synthetase